MKRSLAVPIVLLVVSFAGVAPAQQVCVARSPVSPAEAWLGTAEGLVVRGWSGAPGHRLVLGTDAAWPRFDDRGDLWFERSTDDGHRILATTAWHVPAGSVTPRATTPSTMPPYLTPVTARSTAIKLCIDPGHGGSDPGAIGIGGLQEKDVTLDVGLKLQAWLALDSQDPGGGGDWSVVMTRTTDVYVSLSQRANIANAFGAQSFLSIHMNSFGSPSANGTESYCYPGQEQNAGGQLRNVVQNEALAAWQLTNRGVKSANFAVLRLTTMPATLLEGGFITSPIDVVKLSSATERDTLALHCLFALQQHHGFASYQPGGSSSTGTLKGVVYDTSQGLQVRVVGALVALPDGTFTTTRSPDGYFQFTVPAGTTAYAGTAAGFGAAQASATVPAGGEVWGSFGLTPGNVPMLALPATVPAGGVLTSTATGDPGSPVVLFAALHPGLPLLDLNALGLGVVWPDLATAISVPLGAVPASGTMTISLTAPSVVGARVHGQALLRSGGVWRLSNGAAFEVQ